MVISHGGGLLTLYALAVHQGGHVAAGQGIGLSGTTGTSTGSHLHFEVRQWEVPVDPLPYLGTA